MYFASVNPPNTVNILFLRKFISINNPVCGTGRFAFVSQYVIQDATYLALRLILILLFLIFYVSYLKLLKSFHATG
jgi:hypothetical protein